MSRSPVAWSFVGVQISEFELPFLAAFECSFASAFADALDITFATGEGVAFAVTVGMVGVGEFRTDSCKLIIDLETIERLLEVEETGRGPIMIPLVEATAFSLLAFSDCVRAFIGFIGFIGFGLGANVLE